ncbi:MAG: hypothetical protein Q9216_001791 [Gyalolechia sp. 2 TL-2023]
MPPSSKESHIRFFGYPQPREAQETPPYTAPPANNPVVRGLPLAIIGFRSLRQIKELENYEPRYDPTVIKLTEDANKDLESETLADRNQPSSNSQHRTAAFYTSLYTSQESTPTKVIEGLLSRVSASKTHSTAFLQIIPEKVLAAAEASTSRYAAGRPLSLLDGVPVAIKDELDLDGYEKSLGSPLDFTRKDGGTSWCVQKWEDAGAIIIGKLNMHELGLDTTNNNPRHGTPLNPHNQHYYTGGSSGGSAYAVASGLIPIAHGADGGGSIRIPASYCGLYGLKPSHGRISISPTLSLASSNGVHGPIASNMQDLELAYRMLATPDPQNPSSSLFTAPPLSSPSISSPTGKKLIGIYKPWFNSADPAVLSACEAALKHYTSPSCGYETVPITLPHLHAGQLAHAMTILSEISGGLPYPPPATLTASNKLLLSVGAQTPANDLLLAQKLRSLLMSHLSHLFRLYPGLLIVTPTTPNAGWRISGGEADLRYGVSDANMSVRSMRFVWLANFTGCPAITVPVGMVDGEGNGPEGEGKVPVGLMAMGEWGDEERLLEWGRCGEEWAWKKGEEKVGKAKGWEDTKKWMGSEEKTNLNGEG